MLPARDLPSSCFAKRALAESSGITQAPSLPFLDGALLDDGEH